MRMGAACCSALKLIQAMQLVDLGERSGLAAAQTEANVELVSDDELAI
jgi:hypothetical protein